ncbi:MAG: histidine phosphatase family protein [Methanosphaera sp.]|nr:histidine phosphatase family protein [Methanosphaera sp.]
MPQLYFIRHGQTEANVKGILTGRLETNLTQKGIDDAATLSKELKEDFDYYYCSPLTRTHQTLRAIKGDVDFIIDERITEVSSGDWQGKLKSELPEEEYDLYKKGLLNPPNGESLEDVDKRAKSFLEDMFSKYKDDEKILIVTHNAFMRNLKRMFIDKDKVSEPKNLEIFMVNDEMYKGLNQPEEER